MVFHQDYKDFLSLLERFEVEYLIIGGYAVALHGYVRATGDIDIWINISTENAYKMLKIMLLFGYKKEDFGVEDFTQKDSFIAFGGYGGYFNILCSIKGVEDFAEAFGRKQRVKIGELWINFIDLEDLIKNKTAVGREKDLFDVHQLKKIAFPKNKT